MSTQMTICKIEQFNYTAQSIRKDERDIPVQVARTAAKRIDTHSIFISK